MIACKVRGIFSPTRARDPDSVLSHLLLSRGNKQCNDCETKGKLREGQPSMFREFSKRWK
jgi:hypothetical protein